MGLTIHYRLHSDTRDAKPRHGSSLRMLRKRALDLPFAKVGEVTGTEGRFL